MERIRSLATGGKKAGYVPVQGDGSGHAVSEDAHSRLLPIEDDREHQAQEEEEEEEEENDGLNLKPQSQELPFGWLPYGVFCLLGIAMLWAWNMFLAAGPYFQTRFAGSTWLLKTFQSAELAVSTITNLVVVSILTNMQAGASYHKRIAYALLINVIVFTLLTLSTRIPIGAGIYFALLMLLQGASSVATGALQNGIYAYVSGFGRKEYTQGIMTGQAIAGIAPPLVQIISVLGAPPREADSIDEPEQSSSSAMAYFLTATGISTVTMIAFLYLHGTRRKAAPAMPLLADADGQIADLPRRRVPLATLFRKTFWLACSAFLTFSVTMVYPVFTQQISSTSSNPTNPLFKPAAFIPLALFCWNAGDLFGRLICSVPALRLVEHPHMVFALSIVRIAWIPLYLLCNIKGEGAVIPSDLFYLVIVQFLFGTSNGYVGTICMMGAPEYVDEDEREAAGGFMGLVLVAGLTLGSLLSFLVPT